MNVCAVVVTHNRRELLRECLAALEAQSRPPDRVLVVDNASTDGTATMLAEEYPDVDLVRLTSNGGGAGGFHEGLRRGHSAGADWIWLMDDDTMPTPTALQELLAVSDDGDACCPALLASKVVWTDGRLHPMNYPGFERRRTDLVIAASERALMPLRTATFVSLLVHRRTVDKHGLPLKRYFLWSDDIEYTARILREDTGYLVPASVTVHKTKQPYTAITTSSDRFYFHVRNTLYMLRGTAWAPREKPSLLFSLAVTVVAYLRFNRFAPRKVLVVLRGLRDGLRPGAPVPASP
ncbi:MAG: glycosyltransferase family 2 protein [Solirubrobacteraceae bacterium]